MMLTLDTPIASLSRFAKIFAGRLKKLGITTVRDLLFYFPFRYEDLSNVVAIRDCVPGVKVTVQGVIDLIANRRSPRKRMMITEALIRDETGSMKVVWFQQPFLTKVLPSGTRVALSGILEEDQYGVQLTSPSYEKMTGGATIHTGRLVPVYSLTSSVTEKQFRTVLNAALPCVSSVAEWLPDHIRSRYQLIDLRDALHTIHFPEHTRALADATRRLKFDELFLLQLRNVRSRQQRTLERAPSITFHEAETRAFVEALPFQLTDDQKKSAWEILGDLGGHVERKNQRTEEPKNSSSVHPFIRSSVSPMHRLLEGDVGSGKTVVAAIAAYNVILSGYRVLLMAPTEILAEQHGETLKNLFAQRSVRVGVLTSAHQLKKHDRDVCQLIIGTHALLHTKEPIDNVGLVIIDEQHRFGVQQRAALVARRTTQKETQIDADQSTNKEIFLFPELTYKIRGAIFSVGKALGLGQKEIIYQKALEEEFRMLGLSIERERIIDVLYRGKKVGIYRPDFIIDGKVLIELKAVPFIGKVEERQVWTYLKGSDYRLALLVNFGGTEIAVKRIVYDTVRQRTSASNQRVSALVPHLLSMTATPIPRTLALTLYGDLDLSILKAMPKGRKAIQTRIVHSQGRTSTYAFIAGELKNGRQAFVICPLIDPSDTLGVRSATQEYERLKKDIFSTWVVGLLHGRMKAKEKEATMRAFKDGKIHILVSTAVVEVGVDVPNATIMMIEGAERFGLAQLHQFRGRVGRGEHQSYCFLFAESGGLKTKDRLLAVVRSTDGFALAEEDLRLRGAGDLMGTQQSGVFDLRIATLSDSAIIHETQQAVKQLVEEDATFSTWPPLLERIEQFESSIHPE